MSGQVGWLLLGLVAWLAIATLVGFGVAKAIRARDRQIPDRADSERPPEDGPH
jgi:hypothetical protein